jgi:hypothetical protein
MSRHFLLSRPVLACAGVAAAFVLAAGPAVAATPSATPTTPPVATTKAPATAKPTVVACSLPAVKSANGKPAKIEVVKPGKSGVRTTTIVEVPAATQQGSIDVCRKLLAQKIGLPFPKGAPQTGGGGMADEVSSWR